MPAWYGDCNIGSRWVDFLVEKLIAIERKAIIQLQDVNLAQALYLFGIYHLEIGFLINFSAKSLQYKRLTIRKHPADQSQKSQESSKITVQTT